MAFLLYFVVIVVSVASVMFGIDLASSPLPSMPNVPVGSTVAQAPATPPPEQADKLQAQKARTHGKRADNTRASAAGAADQRARSATAKSEQPRRAPQQAASKAWLPPPPNGQAAPSQTQPVAMPQPVDKPDDQAATAAGDAAQAQADVAAPSNPHCDVQACSAAFRSFRASDCTFQPYHGPRRHCTRTGGAATAATRPQQLQPAQPQAQASAGEAAGRSSDEVSRIVRQMTPGKGDVPVRKADGSIVIVHTGGARAQASCNVAACARAHRSFRASDCTFQPYHGPRRLCTR
jgi:hypothetical protein